MLVKSIRLSDEEARAARVIADLTGEDEASVLNLAILRGLRELRVEQAIRAYLSVGDSTAAAEIAGMPRAPFLDLLVERGIPLLSGPSTVRDEVTYLAEVLDSDRVRAALGATSPSFPSG